ncbi:hypothetical protein TgHK011_002134 [Trichoderma gracile]|nr:hypothetical protein TgHK011_002134 [Trichoderma gracile]
MVKPTRPHQLYAQRTTNGEETVLGSERACVDRMICASDIKHTSVWKTRQCTRSPFRPACRTSWDGPVVEVLPLRC